MEMEVDWLEKEARWAPSDGLHGTTTREIYTQRASSGLAASRPYAGYRWKCSAVHVSLCKLVLTYLGAYVDTLILALA